MACLINKTTSNRTLVIRRPRAPQRLTPRRTSLLLPFPVHRQQSSQPYSFQGCALQGKTGFYSLPPQLYAATRRHEHEQKVRQWELNKLLQYIRKSDQQFDLTRQALGMTPYSTR